MKRIILLLCVLVSFVCNAKPARYYYYCLTPTVESVFDDGYVSVEYVTRSNFKTYTIPGVSSVDYAHPVLEIIVKNNSQENILIYANNSTVKLNSNETQLSVLGPWGDELLIPAGEQRTFSFEFITKENLPAVNDVFSIIKVPMLGEEVPAGKQLGIHVGSYSSYNESNTILNLSSQIVYATQNNVADKYAVTTSYYLSNVVGIAYNGFGEPKKENLIKIFPECMSDKYETFLLINTKK